MKLKRLLSALLATIMVVSQLPVISFAADETHDHGNEVAATSTGTIDVNGSRGTDTSIYWKCEGTDTKTGYDAYAMPVNLKDGFAAKNTSNPNDLQNHAQFIMSGAVSALSALRH